MPAVANCNVVPRGTARVARIQGSSSYATGGYTPPQWLADIIATKAAPDLLAPCGLNEGTVVAQITSGLIKFVTAATGAEVANASDQSGTVVSVLIP